MEELDLRRIEFFIFQLFETFLAYWTTLGDLFLHPTRVLDSLELHRGDPSSSDEERRDEATPLTPSRGERAAPSAPRADGGASSKAHGEDQATLPGLSREGSVGGAAESRKESRWRLGGESFEGRRSRKRKPEARYVFETAVHGVPRVCYPGLFALASFVFVIIIEWVQVNFFSFRFNVARRSFDDMQLEVLVLFGTLFLMAQFADSFYRKRGEKGAARQIFALCCYCSGYLVPKHAIPLLSLFGEEILTTRTLWIIGLLQLPFMVGMALFWIFGVRRIYGGPWRGTLRLAFNAALGASLIYSIGQLFIHVPLLARQINLVRFDTLEGERKYADALVLGERIRKDLSEGRHRRLLDFRLDRLRYHLLADTLLRLDEVTKVLRPWATKRREKIAKGEELLRLEELKALLRSCQKCLSYDPKEFSPKDERMRLSVGSHGIQLDELTIPIRPILPHPLPQAPANLDAAIATLHDELTRNVEKLIVVGDELFRRLQRKEQLSRLNALLQRSKRIGENRLKALLFTVQVEEELQELFWSMEKQRLACMVWLRDYPPRLVDASILPQAFEAAVARTEN